MKPRAPLRFMGLVLIGWIGLRVGAFLPGWLGAPEQAGADSALPSELASTSPPTPAAMPGLALSPLAALGPAWPLARSRSPALFAVPARSPLPPYPAPGIGRRSGQAPILAEAQPATAARPDQEPPSISPIPALPPRGSRWSGSGWLLLRREAGGRALAPGGTLGGSQAGLRLLYRLNDDPARALSISARVYLPLRRADGAEVAIGLNWQPAPELPLQLLAERRQAIGDDGRSAFALTLHGGHSARLAGLRIDAYGQAGIVGLRSRDLFADGALRVAAPAGPVELGGGLWGSVQPGAARLDAGPQVVLPLRAARAGLRLAAEYRFRIAGDAAPGSGPVLTLGTGF